MNWKPIMRLLCHQKEERSYAIAGEPLIVCSRCLGIYAGFVFSFITLIAVHGFSTAGINIFFTAVLFVPMAIDGFSQVFGWRQSNNPLRFITGYLAGFATALIYYSATAGILATAGESPIPSAKSFAALLPLTIFLLLLEKYKGTGNLLLKKSFNFISVFSAAVLILGIILIYFLIFIKLLT